MGDAESSAQTIRNRAHVVTHSIADVRPTGLPAGLALLMRMTQRGGRAPRTLLVIASLGALTTAIANFIEDGVGVDAAGNVYFVAAIITMLSMIASTGALIAGRPRWPGLVVLGIGMLNLELGGGILLLLVWIAAALAVQPHTSR